MPIEPIKTEAGKGRPANWKGAGSAGVSAGGVAPIKQESGNGRSYPAQGTPPKLPAYGAGADPGQPTLPRTSSKSPRPPLR